MKGCAENVASVLMRGNKVGQKVRAADALRIRVKKPLFTEYDKYTSIYLSDSGAQASNDNQVLFL